MVQKSWEKTTWDVQNLANHGINYQPQLAGFLPQTVVTTWPSSPLGSYEHVLTFNWRAWKGGQPKGEPSMKLTSFWPWEKENHRLKHALINLIKWYLSSLENAQDEPTKTKPAFTNIPSSLIQPAHIQLHMAHGVAAFGGHGGRTCMSFAQLMPRWFGFMSLVLPNQHAGRVDMLANTQRGRY